MSLEGLQAVLSKEEIVATQRAEDLLDRPAQVDEAYRRHVRTYVPLGREADGSENGQSVIGFERRVVKEVLAGGALRGYITGEYGYGKTSTALYLWDRARSENLLVVPPFELTKLSDLIVSTFGWIRYEVGRTRPALLNEAEPLYRSLMERSAETLAQRYEMDLAAAHRLAKGRPDVLELTANDYITFLEGMTHLSHQAGFGGLLVLADELQQYIEPEIRAGASDPISPLFDVVSAILTRRGHLNFGLVMVIPPKELALLRDQRGDLVHRALQVSLDLSVIYDGGFPSRLWHRLASEFGFGDHEDRIISEECLLALGQICTRSDLSDGPRTVVNAFRRATQRYIEAGHPSDCAYTPYDLVEDLMSGEIRYDSSKKIPQVVGRALSHTLVRGHPDRERAVIWAAAFPNEGMPRALQEQLGLSNAYDDLAQSALGDLVISVGDIRNRGFTLRGLDQVAISTNWLATTIREFWRTYYETTDTTRVGAIDGFLQLLTTRVFPSNQWNVVDRVKGGLTSNWGVVLEGSFASLARRFPERRVHVRLLWEDEPIKDASALAEVVLQIRLQSHLDWPEEKRRQHAEPVRLNAANRQIDLVLNLMQRHEGSMSTLLEQQVAPIISPFKLTPLLLLTLHSVLDQKRNQNLIPKADDQDIQYGFQPELLDHAFRCLFNPTVGGPLEASEERIVEIALTRVLEEAYPEYDTLMRVGNWASSLLKYQNALKHLETAHERQGQIVYEGSKDEIAELFVLSATGLDTFISNFPSLIEVAQDFPTRREADQGRKAAVRFKLHPLEQTVRAWLAHEQDTDTVQAGGQAFQVRRLAANDVYHRAAARGYRDKEIDAVLGLMQERGMVERDPRRGIVREAVTQAPSVDELAQELTAWRADIAALATAFSDSDQLRVWREEADRAEGFIEAQLRRKADDEQLIRTRKSVRKYRDQLAAFAREKHRLLVKEAAKLANRVPVPDRGQQERLEAVVQGAVTYVQQVNDLRSRLRQEYATFLGQCDTARREIQLTGDAFAVEGLPLASLARLAMDLKAQEVRSQTLEARRGEMAARFSDFAKWCGLVERGSELVEEIQTMGDLVQEHRDRFQALVQEINGHLSRNKLSALPDTPTYELRLNEIAEAVRRVRTEATTRFAAIQERYQQALVSGLGHPRDRLWSPHRYNPVAPDDSHRRLVADVQAALRESWNRLASAIRRDQDSVRSTGASSLLVALPLEQRETLSKDAQELQQLLEGLAADLQRTTQPIADASVIEDSPEAGDGRFHRLVKSLAQVKDTLGRLHVRVEALSRALQALELTDHEDHLLKAIPESSSSMEVAQLRQLARNLSEEPFWSALRGLHGKRRLRIIVEPVSKE